MDEVDLIFIPFHQPCFTPRSLLGREGEREQRERERQRGGREEERHRERGRESVSEHTGGRVSEPERGEVM